MNEQALKSLLSDLNHLYYQFGMRYRKHPEQHKAIRHVSDSACRIINEVDL